MRIRVTLCVLCAVLALSSVPAQSGTITFDGAPDGALAGNQYASSGVLFSIVNGTSVVGSPWSPPGGFSIAGKYVIVSSDASSVASLWITFVDPLNSAIDSYVDGSTISLDLWDTEANVTVNAFNLGNSPLGTLNLSSQYATIGPFSGQVHSLQLVDVGGDGHVLDNLTFGEVYSGGGIQEVPEPGTLALLGGGLLALGLALRKRRV